MVLDPLIQLVQSLAEHIQRHRQTLSQSEALTRYVLIDPFLRALGWNTEDPEQVQPEYAAGGGSADYALLEQGKPQVLVEAKKLGGPLSAALEQNIGYCIRTGAPYLVNTDGQHWEIYDIYKQGPIDKKRLVSFDIASTDQNKVAAAALFLWRGNYREVVVPTQKPQIIAPEPSTPPPEKPPTITLASFEPTPGSKPPTIVTPDGGLLSSTTWAGLSREIVRWLYQGGILSEANCPIKRGPKRYLVHTKPEHSDGTRFYYPHQVGPFWVEPNYTSRDVVQNARFLLKLVNEDPASWVVREEGG